MTPEGQEAGQGSAVVKTPPHTVSAPRDYFIGPVFAATKQSGPREVVVASRRYRIGGFHPLDPSKHPRALDVRHARLLFSILSFRDTFSDDRSIQFSLNELCRRYARTQGGRYASDIKVLLGDLLDSYFQIQNLLTNEAFTYRVIERVVIHQKPIRRRDDKRAGSQQFELWFDSVTLSPEFAGILDRIEELHHIKLEVLTSIRSNLAQAIYLYIPSRAHHHNEKKPFEITLTTLLEQVSHPVPATRKLRKKLFTQNRTPILAQLDGKETLSGTFRVRLAETADGTDWKLQAWVERPAIAEKPKRQLPDSKLVQAFLESGRSREDLERRLKNVPALDSYDEELLEKGSIELQKNERFFELAKALLGTSRFQALLAEAKGDALEGIAPTKNPTARLIFRIMEAVRTPLR